jgi:hypothetical protein
LPGAKDQANQADWMIFLWSFCVLVGVICEIKEYLPFSNTSNIVPLHSKKVIAKSKFNYASLECAAQIIACSENCSKAKAILNLNKDQYASFKTFSNQTSFLIVQLCHEIQIEQISLANYEFFSGTFEKFQLFASEAPDQEWIALGEFDLQLSKQLQTFNLIHQTNPFCKYVKLVFTARPKERNCLITISTLQVYGKSMIEAYKQRITAAKLNWNKEIQIPASNPNVYSDLQQKMHILHLELQETLNKQNYQLYKRIMRIEIIFVLAVACSVSWVFFCRKRIPFNCQ